MELTTRNIFKCKIEAALAVKNKHTEQLKSGYADKKTNRIFDFALINTQFDLSGDKISIPDIAGENVELTITEYKALKKRIETALTKIDYAKMIQDINKCTNYEDLKKLVKNV